MKGDTEMGKRVSSASALSVVCSFLVFVFLVPITSAQLTPAQQDAMKWIDKLDADYRQVATLLWNNPEMATDEFISAGKLIDYLEKYGFAVQKEVVKGLPTTFVGTYGKGKPVIGILAEFDALPGLSQKPGTLTRDPVVKGAPGHGCGHHLYGTSSVTAAIALAKTMEERGIPGTVKLYGTPAEEGYSGKAWMVPAGIFDEADVMLTWHPGTGPSGVDYASNTARISFLAKFTGKAAHAGTNPADGRSALDGYELMNIAIQYMREHMSRDTLIHNIVTSGGAAPNIVPASAAAWYYIRQPSPKTMLETYKWVTDIAKSAATMSQTTVEMQIMSVTYDALVLKSFGKLAADVAQRVGPPPFTPEDQAWGNEVRSKALGLQPVDEPYTTKMAVFDPSRTYPDVPRDGSSADTGNVSWTVPMVSFRVTNWAEGTPGHSWPLVAQGLTSPAFKGGIQVSKYMAATGLELLANPKAIQEIKAEFKGYIEKLGFEDMMKGVPVVPYADLYGTKREAIPGRVPGKAEEYWKKYGLQGDLRVY
jgi:aminobenzoyl-glutamate utilization protein B